MAFSEIETVEMGEQPAALESELKTKLLKDGATIDDISEILDKYGRNTDSVRLKAVISEHLELLSDDRTHRIDEVRIAEDVRDAVEQILLWT